MAKYIDAEKLKRFVESIGLTPQKSADYNDGRDDVKMVVLDFIDSLQQEQQEVDLKEEIASFFSKNPIPYEHIADWPLLKNTALHFFNLGLNARKED